jgi:hypothetical protein
VSSRDLYGEVVKKALTKDGWLITDDPLTLSYGGKDVFVDLGAERTIAAEKNGERIAVEIKSFVGRSDVKDLRDALGQYVMYRKLLQVLGSERELFLAVSVGIYESIFEPPFGRLFAEEEKVNLIIFDTKKETIERWIRH